MKKKIFSISAAIFIVCLNLTACEQTTETIQQLNQLMSQISQTSIAPAESPYLVLVNKEHKLPDDWLDRIELVSATNEIADDDREFLVERKALEHFVLLRDKMLEEGIDIELDSVYRSVDEQIELWEAFKADYGEDYCKKYLAVPGYSEHHTGLAIDVCLVKDGKVIFDNDEMIAEKEIFDEVHKHLAEYGFILRYMPGKEDVTGYAYEPWHFRYVGEGIAKEITERGITLEEYLLGQ